MRTDEFQFYSSILLFLLLSYPWIFFDLFAPPNRLFVWFVQGPVRAVVRAIPIAVLKPMIGASEAVSKTLFGLRNSLDPASRQELEDKYK